MLIEFPILTYIVLLPAVGAVFTYLTGSDRAARAVALGFSVIVLGLSTVLLAGFLWPSGISLPAITTAANHTYFAVEVRRDQVLHVHVPGEPAVAHRDLCLLLLFEPAHVRHAANHRHHADSGGDNRGPDVRRALDRVRHETPDLAVAHVAARRPRG